MPTPARAAAEKAPSAEAIALPAPRLDGTVSLERALAERRSVREFRRAALGLAELSQLLWAGQGVTSAAGCRTAPSAGALYPLELYVVAGEVEPLPAGVYRYVPAAHRLSRVAFGDRRKPLAAAALGQDWMRSAAAALVVASVEERTARKYGARAALYVSFEAGCASENIALEAAALGLGTVVVGAFDDDVVASLLSLRPGERPVAILPVARY